MTDPTTDPRTPDDVPDLRQRERLRGDVRRVERALRHGAVALLVAILALGAALFAGWRAIENGRAIEARLGTRIAERAPGAGAPPRDGDPVAGAEVACV